MGGQEVSGAMGKKKNVKRREGAPGGGLSSLSSNFQLSPGCPERWLKQFRFSPEMTHGMCIGLGVRISDVDLGSYHKSLSAKFSPSVLGCFLLKEAREGRFVSNECGYTSGVAIGILSWMSAISKVSKIRMGWEEGELKGFSLFNAKKEKKFRLHFLTDRNPEILSHLVPKILKNTTR